MKFLAILILLTALFLLYRIAYPKQTNTAKGNDVPPENSKPTADVMGKSRFVLPDRNQPLQTFATLAETETTSEKASIFAAETAEKLSAVILPEELNEVFADEPNLEIMSIPLDGAIDYEAEDETEELNRTLGHEAVMADGIDYDKLQTAVKVLMEQPDEVSEETAETIAALENTDMFEQLVSGNEGKVNWIKAVVERHIQNTMPETGNEISNTNYDYGDFDVADYLD
ncbi:MAG: hypothetical protein LBT24_05770 [Tannerella sp.]|jgi:hypothetical protein|nr:hypothetical protein [Tannerella sp.]